MRDPRRGAGSLPSLLLAPPSPQVLDPSLTQNQQQRANIPPPPPTAPHSF